MKNTKNTTTRTPESIEPKHTTQRIEHIPLKQIAPAPYQRLTNPNQVGLIVKEFDEAKLGVLIVSLRDGNYYLLDGAHRIASLRTLGYTHAYCMVLTGMTFADEAEYFRQQNKNKRLLLPFDYFKAGLISGDKKCIHINEIVGANGLEIAKARNGFAQVSAVGTLFEIYDVYGPDVLHEALWLITETWNGLSKATQSATILGVAEFVSRYGMDGFALHLTDKFALIWERYIKSLQLRSKGGKQMGRKKLCRILVEAYNDGLGANSKRRLKWNDDEVVI